MSKVVISLLFVPEAGNCKAAAGQAVEAVCSAVKGYFIREASSVNVKLCGELQSECC